MKKLVYSIAFTALVAAGGAVAFSPPQSPATVEPAAGDPAPRCGRCGDGNCVRQCGENETTCPRDCAVK